jgi:DNA-directed RNA polymerase specialized sigma subunit
MSNQCIWREQNSAKGKAYLSLREEAEMKDDEIDLWRQHQERDPEAFKKLLSYYKRVVRVWVDHVIKVVPWGDREDLMQEGMIRLAAVIKKFDPDRGYEFTTYARQRVCEALYNGLRSSRNLSRHQYETFKKVDRAQEALILRLERKPTLEEIAQESGLTVRQVERALDARGIAFPVEFIASDSDLPRGTIQIESPENIILIRELFLELDKMESRVLTEYYYFGCTDYETGRLLGLTEDQVKNIRHRALRTLRKLLGATGR